MNLVSTRSLSLSVSIWWFNIPMWLWCFICYSLVVHTLNFSFLQMISTQLLPHPPFPNKWKETTYEITVHNNLGDWKMTGENMSIVPFTMTISSSLTILFKCSFKTWGNMWICNFKLQTEHYVEDVMHLGN